MNLGGHIFTNVNNDTVILLWRAGPHHDGATEVIDVPSHGRGLQGAVGLGVRDCVKRATAPGYELELRVTDEIAAVISKMTEGNPTVGDFCACFQGLVTGGNDAYLVDDSTIMNEGLERDCCRPAVFGDEISSLRPARSANVRHLLDPRLESG